MDFMARMPRVPQKNDVGQINFSGGVNTFFDPIHISENECSDMRNFTTTKYPSLAVRPGFENTFTAGVGVKYLFSMQGVLCYIGANGRIYYADGSGGWNSPSGIVVTGDSFDYCDFGNRSYIAQGSEVLIEFTATYDGNGAFVSFSSRTITVYLNDAQTETLTIDFIVGDNNRLYAANKTDAKLYISQIDQPFWVPDSSYDGSAILPEEMASIQLFYNNVAGCQALVHYADHIIFFKYTSVDELWGYIGSQFKPVVLTDSIGCVSNNSIQTVGAQLFWLGEFGVYTYTGSVPRKVGDRVKKYVDNIDRNRMQDICSCSDEFKYYLALPQKGVGADVILVYDIRYGTWQVWDNLYAINLMTNRRSLAYAPGVSEWSNQFCVKSGDVKIREVGVDDGETVSWYWNSKAYHSASSNTIDPYTITVYGFKKSGSTITINVSYDHGKSWDGLILDKPPEDDFEGLFCVSGMIHPRDGMRKTLMFQIEGENYVEIYSAEVKSRVSKGTWSS